MRAATGSVYDGVRMAAAVGLAAAAATRGTTSAQSMAVTLYRKIHILDTDGITLRVVRGVQEGGGVALNLGDCVAEVQHVESAAFDSAAHPAVS